MTEPVLDDHLHLDPDRGRGIDAVREFARSGGTHLLVVNRPSWDFRDVEEPGDFREGFERTVEVVEKATEVLDGRAWPVLGVHPALVSKLVSRGFDHEETRELMQAGLDVAAEYAADGPAVALKSGRPHYDVPEIEWEISNDVLRHALALGAETGVAVQLHTEATDDLSAVGTWAEDAGLAPERVVKHYADGPCEGVTPSVIARREAVETALEAEVPFMLETDFLDDPDRPGAVLGPRTVPRRTEWLREAHPGAARRVHVEVPRRVYGIDTEATLG